MYIASLIIWLIIGLLMCYLIYGLWIAYRNNKPWNSIRNVAVACVIIFFIGYDLKMEIFVTLGIGVFAGLTIIFLSSLYHRNLKMNDVVLFLSSIVVLLINLPQIHLLVTY